MPDQKARMVIKKFNSKPPFKASLHWELFILELIMFNDMFIYIIIYACVHTVFPFMNN